MVGLPCLVVNNLVRKTRAMAVDPVAHDLSASGNDLAADAAHAHAEATRGN